MNILVLGARAPSCLELVRALHTKDIKVYVADSIHTALCRFSASAEKFIKLSPPAQDYKSWSNEILKVIAQYKISMVIPTCEEVFYLAKLKEDLHQNGLNEPALDLFVSMLECLDRVHNKHTFIEEVLNFSSTIKAPKTSLITSQEMLQEVPHTALDRLVFKPVYSRFAVNTMVSPKPQELAHIYPSSKYPWVMQEKIEGTECCSYAIFDSGKLLAHSSYVPIYRAGKGAGIFFKPIEDEALITFAREFGDRFNYTGQAAFDFIKKGNDFYVLECNPRATSGIHLLSAEQLTAAFVSRKESLNNSVHFNQMVLIAMLLFQVPHAVFNRKTFKKFFADIQSSKDVIWRKSDVKPAVFQGLSTVELTVRALLNKVDILAATTMDIEWNGPNK